MQNETIQSLQEVIRAQNQTIYQLEDRLSVDRGTICQQNADYTRLSCMYSTLDMRTKQMLARIEKLEKDITPIKRDRDNFQRINSKNEWE